jgi:co-chaperonin GroES (HSP10)
MIKLRSANKYVLVTSVAAEETKGGLYIPTESSKKSTATVYAIIKDSTGAFSNDDYIVALSEHAIDLSRTDAKNKDMFAISSENIIAWGKEG